MFLQEFSGCPITFLSQTCKRTVSSQMLIIIAQALLFQVQHKPFMGPSFRARFLWASRQQRSASARELQYCRCGLGRIQPALVSISNLLTKTFFLNLKGQQFRVCSEAQISDFVKVNQSPPSKLCITIATKRAPFSNSKGSIFLKLCRLALMAPLVQSSLAQDRLL